MSEAQVRALCTAPNWLRRGKLWIVWSIMDCVSHTGVSNPHESLGETVYNGAGVEKTLTWGNVSLAFIFNRPCLTVSFSPGSRCYNPQSPLFPLHPPTSRLAVPLSSCLERQASLTTRGAQRFMWMYWIRHLVTTIKIPLFDLFWLGERNHLSSWRCR